MNEQLYQIKTLDYIFYEQQRLPTVKTKQLRTPREEIAFCVWPKIQSQSQIARYGRSIFCLRHPPNFSDTFDLCLHWVSVVRGKNNQKFMMLWASCTFGGQKNLFSPWNIDTAGYYYVYFCLCIKFDVFKNQQKRIFNVGTSQSIMKSKQKWTTKYLFG